MRTINLSVFAVFAVMLVASTLTAAWNTSSDSGRSSLKAVIYNAELALIEDVRSFDVRSGESVVRLEDVSQQINPSSLTLSPADGSKASFRVFERKVDYDYLTADRLLKEYLGEEVLLARLDQRTGVRQEVPARLLSLTGGRVFEINGRMEIDPEGTIILPGSNNPPSLKPYIELALESGSGFEGNLSLAYLTGGLNWSADYTLETSKDSDTASLTCWVSVENSTGIDLQNCDLELVSGQLNRNVSPRGGVQMMAAMKSSDEMLGRGSESFTQSQLGDYHKYSLGRKVDIDNRTANQYELLRVDKLKIDRIYRLSQGHNYFYGRVSSPEERQKVASIIEFTAEGLAQQPFPSGGARVYQREKAGKIYLLGEDSISDTPAGEKVILKTGWAFDIFARRRQLEFKKLSDRLREVSIEIEVINKSGKKVTVQVDENLPGDWKILESSIEYRKIDGSVIRFEPSVKVGATEKITYTVQLM